MSRKQIEEITNSVWLVAAARLVALLTPLLLSAIAGFAYSIHSDLRALQLQIAHIQGQVQTERAVDNSAVQALQVEVKGLDRRVTALENRRP